MSYLDGNTDHPTADMVYTEIKKEIPNISLGTVYRNLSQLEEMGKVIRVSASGQPDRFDYRTDPHYHLMCRGCGKVFDIDLRAPSRITGMAQAAFDGIVEGHYLSYFGLCPNCRGNE